MLVWPAMASSLRDALTTVTPTGRVGARLFLAGALLSGAAGCGTAGFDGTTYRGEDFTFQVPPTPAGWKRIDVSQAALAFRDEENRAIISVNGRCDLDGEDAPLGALTAHLFILFTEREILKQEVVPFDDREAMHTVLTAKLDGVPQKFSVWVMKKDLCVYDLHLIAAPDTFDAAEPAFDAYARGFTVLARDAF